LNSWDDMMDPGAGYWLFFTGEDGTEYSWVPCSDSWMPQI
jgi:hypothetical protein